MGGKKEKSEMKELERREVGKVVVVAWARWQLTWERVGKQAGEQASDKEEEDKPHDVICC